MPCVSNCTRGRVPSWRNERLRSCLLASCLDGNSGKPKADVDAPVDRRGPEAVRRAAVPGAAVPAAAPDRPGRGPRSDHLATVILFVCKLSVEVILRPLPHVAMHIKQPQIVRL